MIEHRSHTHQRSVIMDQLISRLSKHRGLALLAAPAAGVALVAAACGSVGVTGPAYGGNGSTTGSASGDTTAGGNPYRAVPASTGAVSVKVATSGLGSFLTDGHGRTLYLFTRDTGNMSSCTGGCASVWPAVTSSTAAQVGTGASASLLGTASNASGQQITYNGHPLYYYVGDVNPGDTNGERLNQFGGLWYEVSPSGVQVSQ
jgi:predicted lipoprotein with Yx(FWY)xxD motif